MAFFQVRFYARTLGMQTGANVIVPQSDHGIGVGSALKKDRYAVLYLLHGMSDDATIWERRTSLERYVSDMPLAVVMPEVQLSRYENMVHGGQYFDFISEELSAVMESFFPISPDPSHKYIAGLSMGGYGALKIGLTRPEQYAGVGILSSGNLLWRSTDPMSRPRENGGHTLSEAIYGTNDISRLRGSSWDPFTAAEKALSEGRAMPRFFQICGTEDPLLEVSRVTKTWFEAHPQIDYTYKETEGTHNWEFWDTHIQDFLAWTDLI